MEDDRVTLLTALLYALVLKLNEGNKLKAYIGVNKSKTAYLILLAPEKRYESREDLMRNSEYAIKITKDGVVYAYRNINGKELEMIKKIYVMDISSDEIVKALLDLAGLISNEA